MNTLSLLSMPCEVAFELRDFSAWILGTCGVPGTSHIVVCLSFAPQQAKTASLPSAPIYR